MKTERPQQLSLGEITLKIERGQLLAYHSKLKAPSAIDAKQLQRWIIRQLREQVIV